MSVAEDIMNGICCTDCGVYFKKEHGYPVLCADCFDGYSEKEIKYYKLARADEDEL